MKNAVFICLLLVFTNLKAQNLVEVVSQVIRWDSLEAKTENGRTRRLLLEGNTTFLKYFRVHATTIEAGKAPNPPHPNKDADELFIVKEGKIKVTIGEKSKVIEKGGVAVVLSEEVHGIENVGDTPATYYVFRYQSKNSTDLLRGANAGGSLLLNQSDCPFKTHDKGSRRDYYNRAVTQCSVFEMHTTALNAGLESHQPHTHPAEEALLITKGTVTMVIDCKIYQAEAGDLVILASNVPHALINTTGAQCEYFAFTWRN
ncbi:MAG: cupin domain-containing protein [Saprospiraceae bacterium]|nr:cupin domain-containing protein [Saprospiraceae bacterium]